MGYTIIYQRAFIRTTRGIIPTVLGGCSNVTVPYRDAKGRHREVRERSWHPLYRDRATIEIPETDLLNWIGNHPTEPEYELFMFRSEWVLGKHEKDWFNGGIKAACTVEEYLKWNPDQGLRCEVTVNTAEPEWKPQRELLEFCKTTGELEAWIDKAKARIEEVEALYPRVYTHMGIGFTEDRPVKAAPRVDGPVVAKQGNRYLTKYEKGRSYVFSSDAEHAVAFPSIEAAFDELSAFIPLKVRFVRAASVVQATKEKNWVLYFDSGAKVGMYVQRCTRGKLYSCYTSENAQRFANRSNALRCAKSICARFPVQSTIQLRNLKSGEVEAAPVANTQTN